MLLHVAPARRRGLSATPHSMNRREPREAPVTCTVVQAGATAHVRQDYCTVEIGDPASLFLELFLRHQDFTGLYRT